MRCYLLALLFTASVCSHSLAHASQWASLGESDGISLYSQAEPGQNLKTFRGTVRVKAPMKNVLAVLLVRETFPQWFHNMLEDSTLEHDNADSSYCYIWIKGVWPTADRDAVARVSVDQDPATLAVSIIAKSTDPERVPAYKDRVRMPYLYSGFTVRPISATESEIQLEGVANPGGGIPAFAANMVASTLPQKTLANLRKRLETPGLVDLSVLEKVPFAVFSMQKIKLPQY